MDANALTPALGPYSHYIVADPFVFASGQIPIRADGTIPSSAPVGEQTSLAMSNLRDVLEAAGSGMDKVVKVNIYLTNLNDFERMNEVYAGFFDRGRFPARCCVEVLRLSHGVAIEIDAVALLR